MSLYYDVMMTSSIAAFFNDF